MLLASAQEEIQVYLPARSSRWTRLFGARGLAGFWKADKRKIQGVSRLEQVEQLPNYCYAKGDTFVKITGFWKMENEKQPRSV